MRFVLTAPRTARLGWALAVAAVLGGCASGPSRQADAHGAVRAAQLACGRRRSRRQSAGRPREPCRRRAARRADPQRRTQQAVPGARARVRAGDPRCAVQRARPGLVVRPQVPRPQDGERRGLRHVRDDRRAPDLADPELRAHSQSRQRPRGAGPRQRPRPVRRRPHRRPQLCGGVQARPAARRRAGRARADHLRRDPHRRLARSGGVRVAARGRRRGAWLPPGPLRPTCESRRRGADADTTRPARSTCRRRTSPSQPRRSSRRRRRSRRRTARRAVATRGRRAPGRAPAEAARGFWVQLGAFRERDGAETFRRRVGADGESSWLEPLLAIFGDASLYRVQAGPYPSRDEADAAAQRARSALGVVPIVVERR